MFCIESDDPKFAIPKGESYKHLVRLFIEDQASARLATFVVWTLFFVFENSCPPIVRSSEPLKIKKLLTLLGYVLHFSVLTINFEVNELFAIFIVQFRKCSRATLIPTNAPSLTVCWWCLLRFSIQQLARYSV